MKKENDKGSIRKWNVTDYNNLFRANNIINLDNKKRLGMMIPVQVYIQDPYVRGDENKKVINEIHVTRESNMMNGPTSSRIAVVDYNADADCLEEPVIWNANEGQFEIKKKVPLERKHKDTPQFHQVNVWAIIQSILDIYELPFVLGRSVPWGFDGNRLIVVPHAGYMSNAFYDRHSKSIQLYYFGPKKERIYTCLEHDIIAHETGHAILDGLRPLFLEDSSLQTTAFHEFVADMTAILSSLRNNDFRQIMAQGTKDKVLRKSDVTNIGEGFSEYATGNPYLRSATEDVTYRDVKDSICPYRWAELLTATMWNILADVVQRRKKILLEEKRKKTIKQLLWWAYSRFQRIAFQPLDYLPPVDVQFSDYARAVLLADEVAYPDDKYQYREIMKKVFKDRGIDFEECEVVGEKLHPYPYDFNYTVSSRTNAYHFIHENRRQLCIPNDQDVTIFDLYQTNKSLPYEEKKFQETILQYGWREDVPLKGKQFGVLNGEKAALLCGGTLVFDGMGNIISWMRKPGVGKQETSKIRLRNYCTDEVEKGKLRVDALKGYIADRIAKGYVGAKGEGLTTTVDTRMPVTVGTRSDGTIRLEVSPNLRHWLHE